MLLIPTNRENKRFVGILKLPLGTFWVHFIILTDLYTINPHMHVMCTVRGFNKNGTWAKMEKKVYARDKNGDKIPEIQELNDFFDDAKMFLNEAMKYVQNIINSLNTEDKEYDERRRNRTEINNRRDGRSNQKVRKNSTENPVRKQELQRGNHTIKKKSKQTVGPEAQRKSLKEVLKETRALADKMNKERTLERAPKPIRQKSRGWDMEL